MSQYPAVLTIMNDFVAGHNALNDAVVNKAKEMTLAGKMAKGTMRSSEVFGSLDHVPIGWKFSDAYSPTPSVEGPEDQERKKYAPIVSNRIFRRDPATQTVYISVPEDEFKAVRVFKTKADAEEWIAFMYSLGVSQSRIMSEQDIANLGMNWPADSVIANYFETPAA